MTSPTEHGDVPSSNPSPLSPFPEPPPGRSGWPWQAPTASAPGTRASSEELPRISIVVPSFNQGEYIEETIRSILLQAYPNLELIVVDGGSRDRTVEVIRRYEPWIDYWVSEPDRGQTHAINKGLARATGEIFAYLNSDDLLTPGALRAVAEAFATRPESDVVHGGCIYMDDAGGDLFTRYGRAESLLQYVRIWDRFREEDFLTQPEVFSRRERIAAVGGFREELRSVMDFEMWLRLLAGGAKFNRIEVPLAKFRTYVSQKSSVDPGLELCAVVEEYLPAAGRPLSPNDREELRQELRTMKAHLLVRAAIAATRVDRYATGVRYCARAAFVRPAIAFTYPFWAVLGAPLKRVLPRAAVHRIRRVFNPGSP